MGFEGPQSQIPPAFSALKKNGKRAYELARKGEVVELDPRQVTIYWIKDIQVELPKVSFEVYVSKGTYIRSLARDLGEALGTGAHLSALVRTQVGETFGLADALPLDRIEKSDQIDVLLRGLRPQSLLAGWNCLNAQDAEEERALSNGNRIPVDPSRLARQDLNQRLCYMQDHQGRLLSAGFLEFSQDNLLWYQPEKVLA